MTVLGRNPWQIFAGGFGIALALSVLLLGAFAALGAAPARAVCLTPEFAARNFGVQPDFSTTELPNKVTNGCAAEMEITGIGQVGDFPELHAAPTATCKIGKKLANNAQCNLPFWFEPVEPRAYGNEYLFEWENLVNHVKESETINLSGTGRRGFQASSSPVMLFAEDAGNHVFKVDGQSVTCTKAVFEKASLATPAEVVPGVTAAYNGCTAFGFAGATVSMGNCTYELLALNSELNGNLALRCSGGTPVTVNVSIFGSECSVSIGESGNTNLSKLSYKNNNPSAGKVLVTAAITGITAKKNKDNGLCPLSGTGTVTNATYEGPTPFEGTSGVTISIA